MADRAGRHPRLSARLRAGAGRGWGGGGRGVTALEMITIVALLVIIGMAAIPSMSPVVLGHQLRGGAWQVAGDLRLARSQAVTIRKRWRLCVVNCAIGVPAGSYSIERDEGTPTTPRWVSHTGVVSRLPKDVTVSLSQTVTFNVTGNASGGTFTLVNRIGTYQVVASATGRVRVCPGSCN